MYKYKVDVRIEGTAPILQHKFGIAVLDQLQKGATRRTGAPDYSQEWLDTMYTEDGYVVQPATHIEGALIKAAASFTIKGKGRKTWKDPVKASCFVQPDLIPHLFRGEKVEAPSPELLTNPTEHLSVDVSRVKVQRAAVARSRLKISKDWELAFMIEVHDDQVRPEVLEEILQEAGRAVGIGDYRPRFGRFIVTQFEIQQSS